MKIVFLGVGEAFDENLSNTSILVESKTKLLLDCGYSAPQSVWKYNPEPDFLDVLYITHHHADHVFGVPSLLIRFMVDKRKKDLTIIGPSGTEKYIKDILFLAYTKKPEDLPYKIQFIEVKQEKTIVLNELKLSFALSIHPIECLAIKVESQGKSFCYSGDGMFSESSKRLFKNVDMVAHEAYLYEKIFEGHGNVVSLIEMAKECRIKKLAFLHIFRSERNVVKEKILPKNAIVPEPGDVFVL